MDPRQELEELRRLSELEQKLASQDLGEVRKQKEKAMANAYAGQDVSQMGAVMRGLGGAKAAWDTAAMGLKGIVTDLNPEDQALLDQGKAFLKQAGTAGTVGNVAGDVAMTAAPALRAQQGIVAGARYLPQAMQWMGRAVPAAAGAGAVTGAALNPEDRTGAALGGAAGGAIGEGAGRLLTKTLGGAISGRVTPEAKELMEQGAFVPMWKATDSGVVRNLAERAKVLPVAGSVLKGQERSGIESWNKILTKEATPPMPVLDDAGNVLRWENKPVTDIGHAGLNALDQRFNDAYKALYGNRGVPVDDAFNNEVVGLLNGVQRYYPSEAPAVQGIVNKVVDALRMPVEETVTKTGGNAVGKGVVSSKATTPVVTTTEPGREVVSYQAVRTALEDVDKAIRSAWNSGNADKAEALSGLRSALESMRTRGLPPEVQAMAGDVNRAYAKYKTLERSAATLGAQKNGAVVTPAQQLNAIKARDRTPGKSSFAKGNAPGQQQALTAQNVYGNELPDVGPGTAEKLAPLVMFGAPMLLGDLGATAMLGTKTGQKFLMGQLPGQAGIRKYGEEYLVPALRAYGTSIGD